MCNKNKHQRRRREKKTEMDRQRQRRGRERERERYLHLCLEVADYVSQLLFHVAHNLSLRVCRERIPSVRDKYQFNLCAEKCHREGERTVPFDEELHQVFG
jgi:hypothetical protein